MTPSFSAGDEFGSFRLEELLASGQRTETWRAYQENVSRHVSLTILRREAALDEDILSSFREDLQAKSQVEHPQLSKILIANDQDGFHFFSTSYSLEPTLARLVAKGVTLTPDTVRSILHQLSEIRLHFREKGISTLPLDATDIHLGTEDRLFLTNLAIGGNDFEQDTHQEKIHLAEVCTNLLDNQKPGASGILKILAELSGTPPLSWRETFKDTRPPKATPKTKPLAPGRYVRKHVRPMRQESGSSTSIIIWLLIAIVLLLVFLLFL